MIESKYLIFYIGSAICVPAGILLASTSRRIHDAVFVALVLGVTQPASLFGLPTDINFLSRDWYRGTTRGIEISYLDLLAVILLVSSLIMRRRDGFRLYWPPSLGFQISFLLWCCINVALFSQPKLFGIFECTKIARAILLFAAVAMYIRRPREVRIFIWTLIGAVCYETVLSLLDRYAYGMHRIEGTLGHPNSLSMYCLQCVPIFIAVFFAEGVGPRMRTASVIAFLGATACVLFTISRMGVVALFLISAVAFLMCTGFRLSPRNAGLAILGILLMTLMLAKSWDTLSSRMQGTNLSEEYFTQEGDRGSYFRMGMPAIRDFPLSGMGLNNWSYWVTNRYAIEAGYETIEGGLPITPYPSLNEPPRGPTQAAPAHNYYLITVAELGWPGLSLVLAIFGRWLWISGQVLFMRNRDLMSRVRLGAFLSLWGIMLQSWTEWEFRQTSVYFNGHVILAVAATLYYFRSPARRA
ncbi:MAG: O-antigen ligase family protein [Candidatus Hydrogenedentes bacterium]|nr:O-antigen ligase family protein [Candidatus Hydrogenedentota bacterium]